jgi:sulfatase maturation enzyme AslB (radical SAM superfamily)
MSAKCILPWISIETTPMGTTRPCCLYTDEIPEIDLKTSTLEDAFNSKTMRDLRRSFRRGEKPDGCRNCWREEDAGKKSKREYMLEKFKDEPVDYSTNSGNDLVFIDLKLGNICNLKCRICGSWSSSKWAQEELDYEPDNKDHVARDWLKRGQWPRKSPDFWANMDELLPQIKYFEFTGGEPWMIKQHFELLQRAVDRGLAQDIDIHYNTNTTQFPKDPTIWRHFKHVQIAFSVDNTEERFEYERYGAKWKTANTNIKKVHALRDEGYPITTQLCCTWNVQNIYYLDEILTWANTMNFNSIHFNLMHDPWEFSLSRIPHSARSPVMLYLQKQQIKHNKYKNDIIALKQMVVKSDMHDGESGPETGEALHARLRQTDLYRNQNFAHSHSKIAQAIKYEL